MDQVWMQRACDIAYENVESGRGGPFGCVIVRRGEHLADAVNRVVEACDPTAHAEIQALREACKRAGGIDLSDCVVYSSCEPCSMCFSALRWAGVKTIFYDKTRQDAASIGFRDDDIYDQIIERKQDLTRVPMVLSRDAFSLWSSTIQKTEY